MVEKGDKFYQSKDFYKVQQLMITEKLREKVIEGFILWTDTYWNVSIACRYDIDRSLIMWVENCYY